MKDTYKGVTDEEVQKMLEEWDIVTCKYCGKKISLLDAGAVKLENGSEAFFCKSHGSRNN